MQLCFIMLGNLLLFVMFIFRKDLCCSNQKQAKDLAEGQMSCLIMNILAIFLPISFQSTFSIAVLYNNYETAMPPYLGLLVLSLKQQIQPYTRPNKPAAPPRHAVITSRLKSNFELVMISWQWSLLKPGHFFLILNTVTAYENRKNGRKRFHINCNEEFLQQTFIFLITIC